MHNPKIYDEGYINWCQVWIKEHADPQPEIKPCPFCGGTDIKHYRKKQGDYQKVFYQCRQCNARTGVIEARWTEPYEELKTEAAALWNRRS